MQNRAINKQKLLQSVLHKKSSEKQLNTARSCLTRVWCMLPFPCPNPLHLSSSKSRICCSASTCCLKETPDIFSNKEVYFRVCVCVCKFVCESSAIACFGLFSASRTACLGASATYSHYHLQNSVAIVALLSIYQHPNNY